MKSQNEIPKYDLAEQIMSSQRKSAATKRIAPTRKRIKKSSSEIHNLSKPTQTQPYRDFIQSLQTKEHSSKYLIIDTNTPDQILSDIVARDIQNFRKL